MVYLIYMAAPKRSGFTLVELLISVSVLTILASIGFVLYGDVLKHNRDARRKSDLQSIRSALDIYRAENGKYPLSNGSSSTAVQPWLPSISPKYIIDIPTDPLNTPVYKYTYIGHPPMSVSCDPVAVGYILYAKLEDSSDSQVTTTSTAFCAGPPAASSVADTIGSYVLVER